MLKMYRAVRRKTASLLNGFLLSAFGVKIVRGLTKNFSFQRMERSGGTSTVAVTYLTSRETISVALREGTSDWLTFDQIFIDEDYDLRELPRFAELKRIFEQIRGKGTPLIIDLGANIGLSSLYFSMVWPGARIIAIEPDRDNFAQLERNVEGHSGIVALLAGAASRETRLQIMDERAGKNAIRTREAGAGDAGNVEGITMTSILRKYPRSEGFIPFIVKIDIEGAESELFSRDSEWLDEFPLAAVELHDWLFPERKTSLNFLKAVSGLDRDFVYVDENIFSIKNGLSRLPDEGVKEQLSG